MLLALDVGNMTTSVGLFDETGSFVFFHSGYGQAKDRRPDRRGFDEPLPTLYHYDLSEVEGSIFCSVVPSMDFHLQKRR